MIIKLEEEKRELGKFCVAKLMLSTVKAFTFYERNQTAIVVKNY
jgi:hypothetical protein